MKRVVTAALAVFVAIGLACPAFSAKKTIKVGLNVPITGDIPKVGEGSKYAAEMWLESIGNKLKVGGKSYDVEVVSMPEPTEEPAEDKYQFAEEIQEEESLSLHEKELELIKKSLEKYDGKRKDAAKELGISERTLYRKIKQYNL